MMRSDERTAGVAIIGTRQTYNCEHHTDLPSSMRYDARGKISWGLCTMSEGSSQEEKIRGKSAVAVSVHSGLSSFANLRTVATANECREALAQEVKAARVQIKAIKDKNKRFADWFMAGAAMSKMAQPLLKGQGKHTAQHPKQEGECISKGSPVQEAMTRGRRSVLSMLDYQ